MPTATMTAKGQVTVPKAIREALELDAGDRVLFTLRDDGVVELHAETVDVRELFGMLKTRHERPVTVEEMNAAIGRAASASNAR